MCQKPANVTKRGDTLEDVLFEKNRERDGGGGGCGNKVISCFYPSECDFPTNYLKEILWMKCLIHNVCKKLEMRHGVWKRIFRK